MSDAKERLERLLDALDDVEDAGGDDVCRELGIDVAAWAAEIRAEIGARLALRFPSPSPPQREPERGE